MKMILHLMRRDLVQHRNMIFVFLAWVICSFAWELVSINLLTDDEPLDLAMLFKAVIVPCVYLLLCAMMGISDSPRRENHHLLSRPISVGDLYLAKLLLVLAGAALMSASLGLVHLIEGFPFGFFHLFSLCASAGLAVLFLGAIPNASAISLVRWSVFIGLFFIVATVITLAWIHWTTATVYESSLLNVCLYSAVVAFTLFIFRNLSLPSFAKWSAAALTLIGLAIVIPITPFSFPRLDRDEIPAALANPVAKVTLSHRQYLASAYERPPAFERVKHPVRYQARSVEVVLVDGAVYRYPAFRMFTAESRGRSFSNQSFHGRMAQAALGLRTPPERQSKSTPLNHTTAYGGVTLPDHLIGREATVIFHGDLHMEKLIDLGEIDLSEGSELQADELRLKVIQMPSPRRSFITLRYQLIPSRYRRIGVLVRSDASPLNHSKVFHPRGDIVIDGLLKTGDRFLRLDPLILESIGKGESWSLHFYTWEDMGTTEFSSQPVTMKLIPQVQQDEKSPYLAPYQVERSTKPTR